MDTNLSGCKINLAEKDLKLAEAETKIRCLGEERERLEKQIDDLKLKNNVSKFFLNLPFPTTQTQLFFMIKKIVQWMIFSRLIRNYKCFFFSIYF